MRESGMCTQLGYLSHSLTHLIGDRYRTLYEYCQSLLRSFQPLHRSSFSFCRTPQAALIPAFQTVAREHFGRLDIDFLDLFLPVKLSSLSRARAFLWLAFHYHESPSTNPFDGPPARLRPGLVPELVPLTDEEFELENVDPEDERDYAAKMTKLRIEFLAKNARASEGQNPQGKKVVAKSKGRASSPARSVLTKRERSDPDSSPEDGNAEDADLIGVCLKSSYRQTRLIYIVSPQADPHSAENPISQNRSKYLVSFRSPWRPVRPSDNPILSIGQFFNVRYLLDACYCFFPPGLMVSHRGLACCHNC